MSKEAEKLLEEMRNNPKGNYSAADYKTVYTGFGFIRRNGANHYVYIHDKYHDIYATVKKNKPKSPGYATDAVDRIDKANARQLLENTQPEPSEVKNEQPKTTTQKSTSRKKRTRR